MFSNQGAEKNTGDTFGTLEPQFKKTIPESLGVGFTKVGPDRHHSAGQYDVPCSKRVGKIKYLLLYRLTVVGDCVIHWLQCNNYVMFRQAFFLGAPASTMTFQTGCDARGESVLRHRVSS